jgi:hypothetical protein
MKKKTTIVDIGTAAIALGVMTGSCYELVSHCGRLPSSQKISKKEVADSTKANYLSWKKTHPEYGNLYDDNVYFPYATGASRIRLSLVKVP